MYEKLSYDYCFTYRDFIINTCDQVIDLDTKNYEKVNFESEKN